MGFEKLKDNAAKDMEGAEKHDEKRMVQAEKAGPTQEIAIGGDFDMAAAVLAAAEAHDANRGEGGPLFPVLQLKGGPNGGMFMPIDGTPNAIADLMPQGRKPFPGVFMGYRTEVTAWPVKYTERKGDEKPCLNYVVPPNDGANIKRTYDACAAYQFSRDKSQWNYAENGVGHIRPQLQMLWYSPDVDGLIVVQSPAHLDAWYQTLTGLGRHIDPESGKLRAFPGLARVESSVKTTKAGYEIHTHQIEVNSVFNDQTKAVWDKYQDWYESLGEGDKKKIIGWLQGTDAPINADIEESLEVVAHQDADD